MVAGAPGDSVSAVDDPTTPRPGTCESCGDDTVVTQVRRVYLPIDLEQAADRERRGPLDDPMTLDDPAHVGGGPGTSAAEQMTTGDLEWWCEVCRIHYPHQVG